MKNSPVPLIFWFEFSHGRSFRIKNGAISEAHSFIHLGIRGEITGAII